MAGVRVTTHPNMAGVRVDATTPSGGETALHLAAGSGVAPSVAVLLHAGARVDLPNADGDLPLHHAAWEVGGASYTSYFP